MDKKKLFHKDFTLVVIGQIISLFGNGIVRFALPLYLLNQTGSATLFGIVSALSFLPMILLTPIGGIVADRVNKRNVMVTLDLLTAILMLVFFLLL
ncbi:MAG: MFS transporter, partial [Lachnospiraceae bacterium]